MTRAQWVERIVGTHPGLATHGGAWVDFPTSSSNCWGDGLFQDQAGVYRFLSEHCLRVFDTDATVVKIARHISSTIDDPEFTCGAVLVGAVGSRYGVLSSRLTTPLGSTGPRTTIHSLPSGLKRVFVLGGAQSASTGQHVQVVSFPAGASVTEVSEPETGTICVDGFGGKRLSHDGFVASGGVVSAAGADVTLRSLYGVRVAKFAPTEVYFVCGTNDLTAGVLSSDFQVALDAWVTATLAAAPGARIVIQSIFRRPALEGATAPSFRSAASAVATARGATFVDGLAILGDSDISSDLIHPKREAQALIASAVTANTQVSRRTLIYCDSILSGSSLPQNASGYTGPVHLIRAARG